MQADAKYETLKRQTDLMRAMEKEGSASRHSAMGPDILFENHTIKEIQEIEKKLRNDIERKKEELRQMVGERYRDLMEAADTITEMKEIAESVTSCVKSIEDRCIQLEKGSLQKGILSSIQDKVTKTRKQNEFLYSVAAQIKILMDSPTKIWSSIERNDFASAISLFLLAQHTHSLLMLDPVYQEQNISSQFPIISRQWTSINHLKYVLAENCQLILQMQNVEPENVVGPLCCRCLLSSYSLEEIFLEILETRKNVIKSIFRPEKYAKDQICEFVAVVQKTLKIVYVLLYCKEECNDVLEVNLLYQALQTLTSKENPGPVSLLDVNSTEIFKFLPTTVSEFRPVLKKPIVPSDCVFLKEKCNEWLTDIKTCFEKEIKSLLSFVNAVKSLALIRKAVAGYLCKESHWDTLCSNLLQRHFSIWEYFLKDSFLQRIKDIMNEQIKTVSEYCQKDIEETLHKICFETKNSDFECEHNISLYVWLETSNDIKDNIAWIPRHQRNFWNTGELSMKAMGFTPKIQSICKELDTKLQEAVEDVSTFSCLEMEDENHAVENKYSHQKFLADVGQGVDDIFKYLVQDVEKYIFELASYIETTLLYLRNEKDNFENNCRIVFLARLCQAVVNLCPYVNICLSSERLCEDICAFKKQRVKYGFQSHLKESDLWKQLKNKLLEISTSAFKLWSEHEMKRVLKSVDSDLITYSADGLLKALLRWDKIEIQEESEQGKAVNSVLRIPQHISTPLFNALFAFCCQLNAIAGYAIDSDVRSVISKQLLAGLLDIYKKKIHTDSPTDDFTSRLLQVQSLQLLFDVQFLMGLMVHKDSSSDNINQNSQKIINEAVSHIDPFDMDVFAIPLQQNLKKALQKSLSLFGLIASPDQISYLNSIKSQSVNTQMEHNIMLSSSVGSRFPLLPLSSRTSMVTGVTETEISTTKDE